MSAHFTPAAQLEVAPLPDSIEWVQLRDGNAGKSYYLNRCTRATVWKAPLVSRSSGVGERTEEGEVWGLALGYACQYV